MMTGQKIAGFQPLRPEFDSGLGYMGFIVDIMALGRFSPNISVYHASAHFTKCSISIDHLTTDSIWSPYGQHLSITKERERKDRSQMYIGITYEVSVWCFKNYRQGTRTER
jgi:hypothetical protein